MKLSFGEKVFFFCWSLVICCLILGWVFIDKHIKEKPLDIIYIHHSENLN